MRWAALSATALAVLTHTASASWAIAGATSGINNSTGARPFRLPIAELQQSGAAWDLYIQALQYWQSLDQSNMFSWYKVAAIHGLPSESWDGANSAAGDAGYYVGYCRHQSIVFPTWHRPYMALYEEIISIYAHQIAETYPADKIDEYRAAADSLRMPYWDWSIDANIPDIMTQPQITINAAWGSQPMDNPLYRYDFHPYDATAMDGIYAEYNWTVRAPTTSGGQTANQQLLNNQQQFHDGVYQLFSSQSDYSLFSNTAANNAPSGGYQSIENIHNTVHNSVGGDMAYLWIAAQDPIFFLHHANVDRIFAIWQAIYPNSWINESQPISTGTYDVAPNTLEDANTGLSPFHKDNSGTFFNSNDVRHIKDLGYAYREIVDWNVTADELSKSTITWANKVYNPNGSGAAAKRSNVKRVAVDMKSATASNYQYVLNFVIDKSKVNSSLTMNFAINNVSIGSYPILLGGKTKMDMAGAAKSSGQMLLTHALLKLGADLSDRNGTLATIAKGMSWTGEYATGWAVNPSELQDGAVNVQVSTRGVKQTDPEDQFPEYEDWVNLSQAQLGQFASKVLDESEQTVKQITGAISNSTEGIL